MLRDFAISFGILCLLLLKLGKATYGHPCIYPPDSQQSDRSTNTYRKKLPQPASKDAKILLSACNLIEI